MAFGLNEGMTPRTRALLQIRSRVTLPAILGGEAEIPEGAPVFENNMEAFSINALESTYDCANGQHTPVTVGTVAATGDNITYSLSGAQAAGFDVDPATGEIILKTDFVMLEAGIENKWLDKRTFDLVATNEEGSASCEIQVTLDTSSYPVDVPGVDYVIGPTIELTPIDTGNLPTGWAVSGSNPVVIQTTQHNPDPLYGVDLSGYRLSIGHTGAVIEEFYIDDSWASGQQEGITSTINSSPNTFAVLKNGIVKHDGVNRPWKLRGVGGSFGVISKVAAMQCQDDAFQLNACQGSQCYGSTSNRNIYKADGVTLEEDTGKWGHSDGLQMFNVQTDSEFSDSYFDNRHYKFHPTESVNRIPKGTVAITQGSATVTGTGTEWVSGSDNDKLNVGEVVYIYDRKYIVKSVESDTSFTLGNTAAHTQSGQTMEVGTVASSGVTSPLFPEGMPPDSTDNMLGSMLFARNIVRGGGYSLNAPNRYGVVSAVDTTENSPVVTISSGTWGGLIKVGKKIMFPDLLGEEYEIDTVDSTTQITLTSNVSATLDDKEMRHSPFKLALTRFEECYVDQWVYGPRITFSPTVSMENCANLQTLEPFEDVNPVPAAPEVTASAQGADYITLDFEAEDGVYYEYRMRTTEGPGEWSEWEAVPGNNSIAGLEADTSYDFEVRGRNVLADDLVTYLQVGEVGEATLATSAGAGYEEETEAILAEMDTPPVESVQDAMNDLVVALKAAGVWSKFDRLLVATDTKENSLIDWINPGVGDATEVGTMTFTAYKGFKGGSGSYLIFSGFKPVYGGTSKATQNDNSIGGYVTDGHLAPNNYVLGGTARLLIGPRQFARRTFTRNGAGTNENSPVAEDLVSALGLWVNTRRSSTAYEVYGNATNGDDNPTNRAILAAPTLLETESITSNAHVDCELIVGGYNGSSTGSVSQSNANSNYDTAVFFVGSGLTGSEVTAIYNAIYAYLDAVGVY